MLFKKLKRFDVANLFVCKIYRADDLHNEPVPHRISAYHTKWIDHFHGVKILYCNNFVYDNILVDPIYNIQYIPESALDGLHSDRNQYYNKLGNISDIFNPSIIGKKSKISLTKIEELNTILDVEYSRQANKIQ